MTRRQLTVVAGAVVLLLVAAIASLGLGSVRYPVAEVLRVVHWEILPGFLQDLIPGTPARPSAAATQIITELRVPRTVTAIAVGAALAVSGSLLQGALGNPLASPDVIGVTAGAGLGGMIALLIFPNQPELLPVGALVLGLLAAIVVFVVASMGPNGGSVVRLILAGIAISALFGAATNAVMNVYPDRVPSAVPFLAGFLAYEGWDKLGAVAPYIGVGLVLALILIRPLDRLALGDDVAKSLGANPATIRIWASFAAALLAASAAALAGLLGFVGLIVPHAVRLLGGSSTHRFVIPTAAIGGAALVTIGDEVARTVVKGVDLPVGPFMVVIGVPFFLLLLRKAA